MILTKSEQKVKTLQQHHLKWPRDTREQSLHGGPNLWTIRGVVTLGQRQITETVIAGNQSRALTGILDDSACPPTFKPVCQTLH